MDSKVATGHTTIILLGPNYKGWAHNKGNPKIKYRKVTKELHKLTSKLRISLENTEIQNQMTNSKIQLKELYERKLMVTKQSSGPSGID